MISFPCPSCGRTVSVKDDSAGKSGPCPHCQKRITVPAAPTPAEAPTLANAAEAPPAAPAGLDFLAPPQSPDEVGRLGSYRVLKVLGAGGMGMVLLAEDPLLKRSVALKVMRPELAAKPESRERFLREARATAAIEHPNIVHVNQVGEDHGVPFLAMPLLKGEPLDARLKRERRGEVTSPLPVAEVVSIGRQVADGLAAAHRSGLIHRDIKPANLWLERREGDSGSRPAWVKILDFGLARAAADDDGQLTKTGAILGTPAYMAPEQARSEKVDARCDLYSLGAVLYRMLTGETPFKGTDPISFIAALALDAPRPVRELNPETPAPLAELVMGLLEKDPARRPQSARAVAQALAALEEDRTQLLPGPRPAAPPKPAGKRRRWPLAAAGAVLLLGLAVLALILFVHPPPPSGGGPRGEKQPAAPPEKEIVNSIDVKLVRIEPGKFTMGSPPDEPGRRDEEGPQHEVTITKPFYLGAYPVTVGQFKAFVKQTNYRTSAEASGEGTTVRGPNGAWPTDPKITWRNPGFERDDDHPVTCVSWDDAAAFCWWLSKKEGRPYALPSEAQWEYAYRASSAARFPWGDDEQQLADYAWYDPDGAPGTHPVGKKKPNAWGLYDMKGQIWEWTADWYDGDYYKRSPPENPPGPGDSAARFVAVRGGRVFDSAACRAARRGSSSPPSHSYQLQGFRVALLPEQTITNGIGMKLAWVPAGKLTMGSPPGEPGRKDDEGPQHKVTITKPFYLGVYKVTVGEFKAFVEETKYETEAEKNNAGSFVGSSPNRTLDPKINWRNPGQEQGYDQPVVCVSWNDAAAFCSWLSKKEGRRYTLPTEAQWEYACRAGSDGMFSFGDEEWQLNDYAWYQANSAGKLQHVGRKRPNAWGLFDMHGNVYEWCGDWYDKDYYRTGPGQDPPGPGAGEARVQRGGCCTSAAAACRAADRHSSGPWARTAALGFRVVLVP